MRPLKHYLEPGYAMKHAQNDVNSIAKTSIWKPKNSILNPDLVVKGGGGGLVSTLTQKRAKSLKPKGTWISPFAHRAACKENKKVNLTLNQCTNMERSVYVNHCLSLNSQLKPDKLYEELRQQAETNKVT